MEQRGFVHFDAVAHFIVFGCLVAFFFEFFELGFPFCKNNPCFFEFFVYFVQFIDCLLLFFFIDRDAGNLLDEEAPFFGRHRNKPCDVALQNDVVSFGIDVCDRKEFQDLKAGSCFVVDFIDAVSIWSDYS